MEKVYRAFVAAVLLVGFVMCLGPPATTENMHELFLDLHGSVRGLGCFFNGSLPRGQGFKAGSKLFTEGMAGDALHLGRRRSSITGGDHLLDLGLGT